MKRLLPNFETALKQLIASPSISSGNESWDVGNKGVIELLSSWFETIGFETIIHRVPNTRNKYNLLAKLGSGEGGLLLAGHSDTVPFDENRWQSDPMLLNIADNKFYGLGTCDMKGFFAFILEAVSHLSANQLRKPIYVLATADEETTMAGARFFAEQQLIKPDVAVIGEPTNLVPVTMHKGHMSHRIAITGESGHSSKPALGVNAIEIMSQVLQKLIVLQSHLATQYRNDAFDVPQPTLNLGAIKGGDNANRICGYCELDIDMRALPGIKDSELLHWLSEALKPVVQKYPGRLNIIELHPTCPSFGQEVKGDFISVAQEISGHKCCAVNYCTEAPYIQRLGCQTIVMGPGSINQAHQPNEFLAFSEISKTQQILNSLIKRYCLREN